MTQTLKKLSLQTVMLNTVLDIILYDPSIQTEEEAFDGLLHIIAYELSYEVMIQTPWLQQSTLTGVRETLDIELLKEDKWDWLGELYSYRIGNKDYLIDRTVARAYATQNLPTFEVPNTPTILDPVAGSGRLLLALAEAINGNHEVILYGAEPELLAYRMAVLNLHMHGLNYRVVRLNSAAYDIRSQSPNWKFANQWKPVEEKKLFTRAEVDELNVEPMKTPPLVYYKK